MMDDDKVRDELREVLQPLVGAHSDIVANAILASGLFDRIRADAWDEGHGAGTVYNSTKPGNPYRSEA